VTRSKKVSKTSSLFKNRKADCTMADLAPSNGVCSCKPRCLPGTCRRLSETISYASSSSSRSYGYYENDRKRPTKESQERIRSEDLLIDSQMNWFALIQGLLWATLGLFLQAQTESRYRREESSDNKIYYPWIYPLIDFLSVLGILSSLMTLRSIRMLRSYHDTSYYQISWNSILANPFAIKQFSGTTLLLLPLAFATAWILVLLFNSGAF